MDPLKMNPTATRLFEAETLWLWLFVVTLVLLIFAVRYTWSYWRQLRTLDPFVFGASYNIDPRDDGFYSYSVTTGKEILSNSLREMWSIPVSVNRLEAILDFLPQPLNEAVAKLTEVLKDVPHVFHANSHPFSHRRAALFDQGLVRFERLHTIDVETQGNIKRRIQLIGKRVLDDQGFYVGYILLFHDVTPMLHLEQQYHLTASQLKLASSHLQHMLDHAPYLIWSRDKEGRISTINQWFIESFGSDVVADLTKFELGKHTKALGRKAAEQGSMITDRQHIVMKGKRRYLEITEIGQQDGTTYGFAHDITSLEDTQDELERFATTQVELMDSSASAMVVFGSDTRLQMYNNAFLKCWGLTEVFVDRHPTYVEVLEHLREQRLLPEHMQFQDIKDRHLALFTNLTQTHNEFLYLPSGTALRVIVIPHARGGLMFAYEDMTDKLAMERSYNTLIAVQRTTLDNLKEGLVVVGQNGRIRLCNIQFAQLWHVSEEMLKNEPHVNMILDHSEQFYEYPGKWREFREAMMQMMSSRTKMEQTLELSDGKVLNWRAVPLPDGSTLMTYTDMTDSSLLAQSLLERNHALQESNRVKNAFLASISYELRAPLTTIIGFSEILSMNYRGNLNDIQVEYIDGIRHSSHFLMNLINDMIDFNAIHAGIFKLSVDQFDLYKLLTSVLDLYFRMKDTEGKEIIVDCPQNIGDMIGDPTRIAQVITKLISRALQVTTKHSKIVIGIKESSPGELLIFVEDNGVSMRKEETSLEFEDVVPHDSNELVSHSIGLGLAMVKRFIEMHDGRIEIISSGKKGTIVHCYLPRFQPELTAHYLAHKHELQVRPFIREHKDPS